MDFDEVYREIVDEINSMTGIDEEIKQSTFNDIQFYLSLENEGFYDKIVSEQKDNKIRDILLDLHKQLDYNVFINFKNCLSILKTQKYCLFFTSIEYFGTATCNDFLHNKKFSQLFSLLFLKKINGPISPSTLSNKNKLEHNPSFALKNAYDSIRNISNTEPYQNVLVINRKLEVIFLGDFEKDIYNKDVDIIINQAKRKKNYPFNQINKILNIGESIPSNYILLEKYLDINRVSDWKEKEKTFNMVFFLTNVSAEYNHISKFKTIRLPDKIAFSNPIILNGNDAFEIINYYKNKNNLNFQLHNICVSIRGLGVVFLGKKRDLYTMNIEQIHEFCFESIFYFDFYLSNYLNSTVLSKLNIDPEKLYKNKLTEYRVSDIDNNPELNRKFKDAILKTIKDHDNHFEEKLKINIAEIVRLPLNVVHPENRV